MQYNDIYSWHNAENIQVDMVPLESVLTEWQTKPISSNKSPTLYLYKFVLSIQETVVKARSLDSYILNKILTHYGRWWHKNFFFFTNVPNICSLTLFPSSVSACLFLAYFFIRISTSSMTSSNVPLAEGLLCRHLLIIGSKTCFSLSLM